MSSRSKQDQSKRRQKRQMEHQRFVLGRLRMAWSEHDPIHACLINTAWREDGKATILLARSRGGRRLNMAAFLVDLWAMGLKDAWGRLDMTIGEFNESLRCMHKLRMKPVALDTARHIIHGGVWLAQELGFRLPSRHDRWTAMLGALPDGTQPDRSLFLNHGRICLVSSMQELRERLVGMSPEAFLQRPDVEFILEESDYAPGFCEEDGMPTDVDQLAVDMEQALASRIRQWCFASGRIPHALLPEAVGCLLDVVLQPASEDSDDPSDEAAQLDGLSTRMLEFLQAANPHEDPAEIFAAMQLARDFVGSLDSPEELMQTLGLHP